MYFSHFMANRVEEKRYNLSDKLKSQMNTKRQKLFHSLIFFLQKLVTRYSKEAMGKLNWNDLALLRTSNEKKKLLEFSYYYILKITYKRYTKLLILVFFSHKGLEDRLFLVLHFIFDCQKHLISLSKFSFWKKCFRGARWRGKMMMNVLKHRFTYFSVVSKRRVNLHLINIFLRMQKIFVLDYDGSLIH